MVSLYVAPLRYFLSKPLAFTRENPPSERWSDTWPTVKYLEVNEVDNDETETGGVCYGRLEKGRE